MRERLLVIKLGFVLVIVLTSAVVLWARTTSESLLGRDTFPEAIFTVLVWALPALALYLLAAWSLPTVVIDGALLTVLFGGTWWSAAADTHSTASVGPALAGWILAPLVIVVTALVVAVRRRIARR